MVTRRVQRTVGGVPGAPSLIERDRSGMNDQAIPSHVTPPRLIKKIMPLYPEIAQKSHVQGSVILEAVTDISGRVAKVRVITGHPLLQVAAIQAVQQWVYEPYIINGYPKAVVFTVSDLLTSGGPLSVKKAHYQLILCWFCVILSFKCWIIK